MSVPDSNFTKILRAVQGVVTNLNLPRINRVIRRKKPLVAEDDVLPIIVVSPETEKESGLTTRNEEFIKYPVRVTLFFAGNELLETDVDDLLNYREQIRLALYVTALNGCTGVFDCDMELDPPFPEEYRKAEYDVSSIRVFYNNGELRHGV